MSSAIERCAAVEARQLAQDDDGSVLGDIGNLVLVEQCAGDRIAKLEGTYLAWLDVRDLALEDADAHFEAHGLGLSTGAQFGDPGYVRFNFACPRPQLTEGLERLRRALAG